MYSQYLNVSCVDDDDIVEKLVGHVTPTSNLLLNMSGRMGTGRVSPI